MIDIIVSISCRGYKRAIPGETSLQNHFLPPLGPDIIYSIQRKLFTSQSTPQIRISNLKYRRLVLLYVPRGTISHRLHELVADFGLVS